MNLGGNKEVEEGGWVRSRPAAADSVHLPLSKHVHPRGRPGSWVYWAARERLGSVKYPAPNQFEKIGVESLSKSIPRL